MRCVFATVVDICATLSGYWWVEPEVLTGLRKGLVILSKVSVDATEIVRRHLISWIRFQPKFISLACFF
jgi:hypothetical protein